MLPAWTLLPFVSLVLAMALLPLLVPHWWERPRFQACVVAGCALPLGFYLYGRGLQTELAHCLSEYATFIATLGALYVAASGVFVDADLKATPGANARLLLVGSVLASAIGTTGASILMLRPLLRANCQRRYTGHLVPFFILSVSNAGGLLTPLGDPPLLIGFIGGVPFLWTLRLLPIWLIYTLLFACLLYVVDRRAYGQEAPEALLHDEAEPQPWSVKGKRNLLLLAVVVGAAFLPPGWREFVLLGVAVASYVGTPRELHRVNDFTFVPMLEVALLFGGLFVCLVPVQRVLGQLAPQLPLQHSYQLFWCSGLLSALLDNAPTYAAFAALAQGLSHGRADLIAGVAPLHLVAISVGCVVMGATTYIGNAPNLMVKAIAERSGLFMPSFVRYALFAFITMLPAHLLVTAALIALEHQALPGATWFGP